MKKLIFSAIAICGFMAVNAQNSSNSSAPNTTAPAVTSSANISLTLYNALEITPASAAAPYAATFQTVSDFNGPAKSMGSNSWNVKSTRPGIISVGFSNLTDALTSVSVPASAMQYDPGTGMVGASTSTVQAGSFLAGATNPFNMAIQVHPGWGVQGGVYTGGVTITATQL